MSHQLRGQLARRSSPRYTWARCVPSRHPLLFSHGAHDMFAAQLYSVKVEHVGRSHAQNDTGTIRRRLHLVIDPRDSRAHNDVASFVPYVAPAPLATFRAEQ